MTFLFFISTVDFFFFYQDVSDNLLNLFMFSI